MSRFSEVFKSVIEGNGNNIYKIAKNAGVDRSTIHKTISGDRLPNIEFINKLCDYLQLDMTERAKLYDSYKISKIGEHKYYARLQIKELIERMADVPVNFSAEAEKPLITEIRNCTIAKGKYSVNNLITAVLKDEVASNESPKVLCTIPFTEIQFFDTLHSLYVQHNGKIEIQHIISLIKQNKDLASITENLKILSSTMHISMCYKGGYAPHYFFQTLSAAEIQTCLTSHYLVTTKYVLTVSPDFKTAIVYTDKGLRELHTEHFNKLLKLCKPFIKQIDNALEMLVHYNNSEPDGATVIWLEPQPCLAQLFTAEMTDKKLRPQQLPEHTALMRELAIARFDKIRRHKKIINIFSVSGLASFVETGSILDMPKQYVVPFDEQERCDLLNGFKARVLSENTQAVILDQTKFNLPDSLMISCCENGCLNITSPQHSSGEFLSITIDEPLTVSMFYDFLGALPTSDFVYSQNETISILDGFIEKLELI